MEKHNNTGKKHMDNRRFRACCVSTALLALIFYPHFWARAPNEAQFAVQQILHGSIKNRKTRTWNPCRCSDLVVASNFCKRKNAETTQFLIAHSPLCNILPRLILASNQQISFSDDSEFFECDHHDQRSGSLELSNRAIAKCNWLGFLPQIALELLIAKLKH